VISHQDTLLSDQVFGGLLGTGATVEELPVGGIAVRCLIDGAG
jgi:hypothetical protein